MPENNHDTGWINASPTKDFFISMLTRDVPLERAILDLVDNCVDGARQERPGKNYEGLKVIVEVSPERFRIADNCGGIPVETARMTAFRFGRPTSAEPTPNSIGQFGVGMKRSLFKLGRYFKVESATKTSRFVVEEDVDLWMMQQDGGDTNWHFRFAHLDENAADVVPEEIGTRIEVTRLHASIADSFALENFITRLADEISVAHALNMDCGLSISLNGRALKYEPQLLLQSDILQPAFVEKTYSRRIVDRLEGEPVHVRLYAGVEGVTSSERNKDDGGWYVFCNGRLVMRADQSSKTVWGSDHNMRKYHPNFAFFRGYAYFESKDASLLPWTTTKTGVDTDSAIYKLAQKEMVEITKPVVKFLLQFEEERAASKAGDQEETPLVEALQSARPTRVQAIEAPVEFSAPKPGLPNEGPKMQKIQYSKPAGEVEQAKQVLGVTSLKDVGERTFDYYMEYEGGN